MTPLAPSQSSTQVLLARERVEVERRPSPRGFGLRTKFVIFVSIAFVASGLLFGWSFSRQYQKMLRGEFRKRGETLVRGLAANGRLDVWAGNKERLKRLVES